jgi:hypothetical protein
LRYDKGVLLDWQSPVEDHAPNSKERNQTALRNIKPPSFGGSLSEL